MSRKTDPRVENVLARIDEWHAKDRDPEAGRFVENMLERVDFSSMSADELRRIVLAVASDASDELLDALNDEADEEHHTFLDCTAGNDIAAAIQECGVANAAVAEKMAHKVIREALTLSRQQGEPTEPEAA